MKYEELLAQFGDRPYFELAEVLALSDNSPKSVKNQLSNWVQAGKLIRLRRGKYLINTPYRKFTPSVYYLSNCLLRPSYVSLHSALQHHGMIPEAVGMVQAVTPKHGNRWETRVETFRYHSIRTNRFWGYSTYDPGQNRNAQTRFLMARPEKALVDLFYHQTGEWTPERLRQMRFQKTDQVQPDLLEEFASDFDSPKVSRACHQFASLFIESIS